MIGLIVFSSVISGGWANISGLTPALPNLQFGSPIVGSETRL
jgi:hypothetical protein